MEPIRKVNLSELIYRQLLMMIDKEEFKLGDKLPPESDLSKLLGASRTVIRGHETSCRD